MQKIDGSLNLFSKIAVLTPSRITSAQRHGFSKASMESLRKCLKGETFAHVVVHDSPAWKRLVPKSFYHLFGQLQWDERAQGIYSQDDLVWLHGMGAGSAGALLTAVNAAMEKGKIYGFIHLDDHVYCEDFGTLLRFGLSAMEGRPDLLWTRFSGYPVMCDRRAPLIPTANNEIVFDGVILSAWKNQDFTLWSSPLNVEINSGNYWPVAMWFCIYQLSVLKTLLEWAVAEGTKHLAHVELYYKNGGGFQRLMKNFPAGTFGYINMQFGGFEMHRNPNWQELLALPNNPIR